MKIFKRILPIVIIVVVVGMVYSFFHISGWEIKNINKLSDAGYVTVVVRNESNDEMQNRQNFCKISLKKILIQEDLPLPLSEYSQRMNIQY